jgi:hypothetical protein
VNHAVGVLKDRLIGMLITDNSFAWNYLISGTGIGDTAAGSAGTTKPRSSEEDIFEKTAFSSQPQVKLLRGRQEGNKSLLSLFLNLLTVDCPPRLCQNYRNADVNGVKYHRRLVWNSSPEEAAIR